ncbi:MAG: ATP-binding protein [Saprospiraceae bacterium]|nr:ATP-binding protein [Saprospiraceae bacterium]
MINRHLAEKARLLSTKFPIVALTGARQSGKSTLVKHLFSDKPYVSLEDPDVQLIAQTDPRGFLSNYPNGAILDEIQHVPALFSYLQTIVDAQDKTGLFILSGSQNFLLMQNISQSLAGRVALLKLLPFSYEELTTTEFKHAQIDDWLLKGFYPRLYDRNIDPQDYYPNYIKTYLERDVRLLKNINDLSLFNRFMKLCAARIGTVLNYASLANDCGVAVNTIKAWVSVLEASYVVYLLPSYHQNFNKRLIKAPKIYFYDTGLASALLNIQTTTQVSTHYLRGGLFENLIISEVIKYFYNQGKDAPCYFWQNQVGKEIDLIVEMPNGVKAFEIKSSMTLNKSFFNNLTYWKGLVSEQIKVETHVVYAGNQLFKTSNGDYIRLEDIKQYLM